MFTQTLHDSQQSAYCTFHSTESALLKVHQNIAQHLDNKSMAALVLRYLSAVFQVTDRGILQKRLKCSSGVTESILS